LKWSNADSEKTLKDARVIEETGGGHTPSAECILQHVNVSVNVLRIDRILKLSFV